MRQILARKDLVQLGEIEIGSWRYRYGSLFLSQLRLSPKQFVHLSKKYNIKKDPLEFQRVLNGSYAPALSAPFGLPIAGVLRI